MCIKVARKMTFESVGLRGGEQTNVYVVKNSNRLAMRGLLRIYFEKFFINRLAVQNIHESFKEIVVFLF